MTVSDALTRQVALPWFLKDISGLHYDRTRRQLYVLSHESAIVLVSDLSGGKKVMLLRRGFHGLKRDIPQAEGIASDDRDTLWIVSEPQFVLPVQPGRDVLKLGHICGQRGCMPFSDNNEHPYVRGVDNEKNNFIFTVPVSVHTFCYASRSC